MHQSFLSPKVLCYIIYGTYACAGFLPDTKFLWIHDFLCSDITDYTIHYPCIWIMQAKSTGAGHTQTKCMYIHICCYCAFKTCTSYYAHVQVLHRVIHVHVLHTYVIDDYVFACNQNSFICHLNCTYEQCIKFITQSQFILHMPY